MEVIDSTPGIRVQVHYTAGSLEKISLSSSPQFALDCPSAQIEPFRAWLKAYSQARSQGQFISFSLPLPSDTFQGDVLRFLQTIPWGSVCSYKDVAKAVGSPRAARAVGNICRGNLFPLLIPCHRVIKSNGGIGRYTPDLSLKKQLLHFEGVTFSTTEKPS